jgi:hypothetical protein
MSQCFSRDLDAHTHASTTVAAQAIQFLLQAPSVSGPVNVVSPNPVTNKEFTDAFGRALIRPTVSFLRGSLRAHSCDGAGVCGGWSRGVVA